MMKTQSFFWRLVVVGITILVLVSCSSSVQDTQTPTAPATFGETVSAVPTQTVTATSSSTPIVISTMTSQTPTPTVPTPILTQSVTSIPTPLPTVPPNEVEAFVLDLLQNSIDCQLPCFWGAVPGETTWLEYEAFLATFSSDITLLGEPKPQTSARTYEVLVPIPDAVNNKIRFFYMVRPDDIVQTIRIELGGSSNYSLPQVLTAYGRPDEVWMATGKAPLEGFLPFVLTLYYKQHGFIIEYADNADLQDGQVVGCFQQLEYPRYPDLFIWALGEELTFMEAVEVAGFYPTENFLTLEEATDLSLETFYQEFKDSSNVTCLYTPADLWPSP